MPLDACLVSNVPSGDDLSRRRRALGLTMMELAAVLQVSQPAVSRWESSDPVQARSRSRVMVSLAMEGLEARLAKKHPDRAFSS